MSAQFFNSKQDTHNKTEKVYNDWESTLKSLTVDSCNVHEESQKTAKLFAQVDTLAKNSTHSLNKSSSLLDQLLDKKLGILATTKSLNEIHDLLSMDQPTKTHWQ